MTTMTVERMMPSADIEISRGPCNCTCGSCHTSSHCGNVNSDCHDRETRIERITNGYTIWNEIALPDGNGHCGCRCKGCTDHDHCDIEANGCDRE